MSTRKNVQAYSRKPEMGERRLTDGHSTHENVIKA